MKEDDLILCRCEEVTLTEIRDAIRAGCRSLDEIKRYTRAGMGLCQGRTCGRLISRLIHEETGIPLEEIKPMKRRFPLKPIKLKVIARDRD
jgi:NAD(P)H-nitrite reductase large subunit